ncbi:hypothetical protein P7K49_032244 [Saguinus oedipus]|uniref:Uncharacterized protein n=1 Tax=Saguinus oedipus TaxID=9490 RepID=A0ABQ9TXQ6_SAGOE|nr:hypothetical protein P7K49_032244 [Saguinus oedipus]
MQIILDEDPQLNPIGASSIANQALILGPSAGWATPVHKPRFCTVGVFHTNPSMGQWLLGHSEDTKLPTLPTPQAAGADLPVRESTSGGFADCSRHVIYALRVRKKMSGEKMPVKMIGDILSAQLPHMQPYIRFCSRQLNGAALIQQKTDEAPDFKEFVKVRIQAVQRLGPRVAIVGLLDM